MKSFLLLFFILIVLNNIKCYVTNQTKSAEGTTAAELLNNGTQKTLPEFKDNNEKKHELPKTKEKMKTEERVYLNDVIYAIKNQNWTTEEEFCLNQTLFLLQSLQNFTLWAVWNWDSIPSEPQGLLYGSQYQLGNFDECMNAPWTNSHPELKTQYCLVDIELESIHKKKKSYDPYQSVTRFLQSDSFHPLNKLTWGACVPASCNNLSVKRLFAILLARSHFGTAGLRPHISINTPCQKIDEPREYDLIFYAFMALIAFLAIIVLICTYLNSKRSESDNESLKNKIVKALCIKKNAKKLLEVKKEGLEAFYCIKFLTICCIVLDHQGSMQNAIAITNGLQIDKLYTSTLTLFIVHDDLFVDTFFMLSGFLMAAAFTKLKKFPNPVIIIFKRYMRLAISFAFVIFYMCAVFPYTGSGPLWPQALASESDRCRKNWWISLLMLNNYIDFENICLVVTWYIPCDFHFSVLAILLFWLHSRQPRLAVICKIVLSVAAVLTPGVITYIYNMPPIQSFSYDFLTNPRTHLQFSMMYVKSHTRFAAYLVGLFNGYMFALYKDTGDMNRISQKWATLGAISGIVVMVVVMISGVLLQWRGYSVVEAAVYVSLNRPAWAGGVALLVLCCAFGNVPLIKSILTWYPWVPLSRLSYGLYLVHSIFIIRNIGVTRTPKYFDYFEIFLSTAGVIFWGCICALVMFLLVEAPINNLITLCLRTQLKDSKEGNVNRAFNNTSENDLHENEAVNKGCLRENLPSSISFSSKM